MISKNLLIHKAKAFKIKGKDCDRNPILSEEIPLSNIRITAVKAHVLGSIGIESQDKLTMYFDCKYSLPKGFIPAVGMIIFFEDQEYSIRVVKKGISKKIEHYEASLV